MNNIEIEIQVKIENSERLLEFLKQNAAFKSEKRQVDEYFSPAHRNFLEKRPVSEWLRLREEAGKYSLNYKKWHFDENGKSLDYCDEYETKIEDIETIKKILNALNFKSLTIVDKSRKIYIYGNYEIALDSVKNLGDFVEIEYISNEDNPDQTKIAQITEKMVNFLKNLGCGRITKNSVGYPFLLLFPEEAKFEEK